MTRIGIVGAGRAATLHAEALRALPGVELAGICGADPLSTRVATLAGVHGSPVLALPELVERSDALVVAIPPGRRSDVVAPAAGVVGAVLVESPLASTLAAARSLVSEATASGPVMVGLNLLHAPAVRQALTLVGEMDRPHHLELRVSAPPPHRRPDVRRSFGGGVVLDPGAHLLPVLMAAAGSAVRRVSARIDRDRYGVDTSARLRLDHVDDRFSEATLVWTGGSATASLEVADSTSVVRVDLLPVPTVERDGRVVVLAVDPNPMVALGFVGQLARLVGAARGSSHAWPPASVGAGVVAVAVAAAVSAASEGDEVDVSEVPLDLAPAEILAGHDRSGEGSPPAAPGSGGDMR
ncbi:MAG: Gfo/Idh/MocA family protein [Acidimicrobiales bacterium]